MRPLLSIKTLFRTPFKTLLTFILLTSVMFALFTRIAEYSITEREIKNAAKQYRGIGSAEISEAVESLPDSPFYILTDPRMLEDASEESGNYFLDIFRYQPLSREQIHSILKLPYITASDTRYMTAGVSDQYYRLDDGIDYYNYTARYIIEATLSEIEIQGGTNYNQIKLKDCIVLAGNPNCLAEKKEITVYSYPEQLPALTSSSHGGVSRVLIVYDDSYKNDTEYLKNLTIGNRYVFVGRYEPLADPIRYYLSDHLTNSWCEAIQPIEGQPANYLETEQYGPLRELVELTNADVHTFDVVYTNDMSSIMRFAKGDMVVTKGRKLIQEDSLNQSSVCVVSSTFASVNNLDVGDKITLKLGTELFQQYKGLGAVAATHERYSSQDTTVELEIVGIYVDADGKNGQLNKPHWSYSINTIFVPKWLLPLDESKLNDHVFSPSEFSFIVGDAWNIPSFIDNMEKITSEYEAMGLKFIFHDAGWLDIMDKFAMSRKLSLTAILALLAAIVAATGFIVFLFIGRKKREYAIMRALGTTKKESAKALMIPLMVLAISAVLLGSGTAWIYTTKTIAENDTLSIIQGYTINTTVPVTTAIGCIVGGIMLVFLFALSQLWRIGKIPPLMQLQDNQNKQTRSKKREQSGKKQISIENKAPTETATLSETLIPNIPDACRKINRKTSRGHVRRYILRHIRRSIAKSLLLIVLSALLLGAVGQFAVMRQSYIQLCNSTVIKAKFINGLPLISVKRITETGNTINPYYEYTRFANFNNSKADVIVTNDIIRYTGEDAEIKYAKGYDASCIKEVGLVCIVGSKFLEKNELKLGDKVHVTSTGLLDYLQSKWINRYRSEHPEQVISDEEILEINNDLIEEEFLDEGLYYTIAGTVTTPTGKYDKTVFTPGIYDTIPIFGHKVSLDFAEFTLADNLLSDKFRSYADRIVSDESLAKQVTFVMDTSKIDNLLKTLELMNKLYPMVVAAAVLIGGLLCGLIILQYSKEAAIMRVLGTTRLRTSMILVIEQLILCIVGIALGVGGLILYNGAVLKEIASKLYLFAGLYFAVSLVSTLICSAIATRRNVLNLLQTKE